MRVRPQGPDPHLRLSALEQFLAWKSEAHGIDPLGSSLYTNPVSGTQKTFPNIAGHRDVNATDCPGGVFYSTLPSLRQAVAGRIAPAPGFSLSVSPTSMTVVRGGSASYTVSVAPDTDFTASVALSVSCVPAGASASFTPPILTAGSSMLTVTTSAKKTPAREEHAHDHRNRWGRQPLGHGNARGHPAVGASPAAVDGAVKRYVER